MVAEHWGCSVDTVYRRLADGTLRCIRVQGMIRISRDQVLACEEQCTNSGSTQTAPSISSMVPVSKSAFQRGRGERGAAERVLAQFIAGASAPVVEQPTITDILRGYQRERAPEIRAAETLRFNVQVLIRHIGLLQPMHLLPAIIRDYAKKRTAEGVKPGTILREVGVLRAAHWAVTDNGSKKSRKSPTHKNAATARSLANEG